MRLTQYSYSEHFKAWEKVIRSAINILKLLTLFILYLIVKHMDVKQKADKRRQNWTSEVLLFYNQIFFIAICLVLLLRVSKNQTVVVATSIAIGCVASFFVGKSIDFFIRGM